jgi:hypothetical protein
MTKIEAILELDTSNPKVVHPALPPFTHLSSFRQGAVDEALIKSKEIISLHPCNPGQLPE